MRYCSSPNCFKRDNPDTRTSCISCGAMLVPPPWMRDMMQNIPPEYRPILYQPHPLSSRPSYGIFGREILPIKYPPHSLPSTLSYGPFTHPIFRVTEPPQRSGYKLGRYLILLVIGVILWRIFFHA